VRLYGSASNAVLAIGSSVIDTGAAGTAADTVDQLYYSRYAQAGVSNFYIRNFPQYNAVYQGTNEGRSYYDSLQLRLSRQAGGARFSANYTWSKSIDNGSGEGGSYGSVLDNYNLRLNRGRSDFDRTHVLKGTATYALPAGRGRRKGSNWPHWLNAVAGGWELGFLAVAESGSPFLVQSGYRTTGTTMTTADFSGDRNIGSATRHGDGVYWFTPDQIKQFTLPAAGETGNTGRNTFRGPRFLDTDLSFGKRARVQERMALALRVEAFNVFNYVNFANPSPSLSVPGSFGKISQTVQGAPGLPLGEPFGGPRVLQLVARLEF
jgi:hypothetical protein